MPQIPHVERHFTGSATVRDLVIGMSDGLTVPFALAAGLSGVVDTTRLIVTAGLAEIAAGAIAMGLGGYLAAQSETEHYHAERQREVTEVAEKPEAEVTETAEVFRSYGVTEEGLHTNCFLANAWAVTLGPPAIVLVVPIHPGDPRPAPAGSQGSVVPPGSSEAPPALQPPAPRTPPDPEKRRSGARLSV
jgi:VIT family